MLEKFDMALFVSVIGALTLVTNIITEVLKGTLKTKNFPLQIVATIVSMVLTLVTFFAYTSINNIEVTWYAVAGAIVTGFFVSYAAQFGFDKLKEIINKYKVVK